MRTTLHRLNARTLLLIATPALLPLAACGERPAADTATAPARGIPVRTATVAARDLDQTLVLTGTLKPRAQVELVAEVAARLERVLRDEGARVAKGETLALLDDTDYRLANDMRPKRISETLSAGLSTPEINGRVPSTASLCVHGRSFVLSWAAPASQGVRGGRR